MLTLLVSMKQSHFRVVDLAADNNVQSQLFLMSQRGGDQSAGSGTIGFAERPERRRLAH